MGSVSAKGASITEGNGEFQDIPDDVYDARIMDVSDQFQTTSPQDGKERTQITVTWELLPTAEQVDLGCPEGYTRKIWVTLTDIFLETGHVHEKSRLADLLGVLGDEDGDPLYDLDGELDFDSDDWIDARARVVIEHNAKGYPTIKSLMKPRQKAKAPAAAGRPARRETPRYTDWEAGFRADHAATKCPCRHRMAARSSNHLDGGSLL